MTSTVSYSAYHRALWYTDIFTIWVRLCFKDVGSWSAASVAGPLILSQLHSLCSYLKLPKATTVANNLSPRVSVQIFLPNSVTPPNYAYLRSTIPFIEGYIIFVTHSMIPVSLYNDTFSPNLMILKYPTMMTLSSPVQWSWYPTSMKFFQS